MALDPSIDAKLSENDKVLGLPDGFTRAHFMTESGLKGTAVSPKGARGWAQVMPETQASLEKRLGRKLDPTNIDDALEMHRAVMGENLTKFGNLPDALRAYNGGWDRSKWENKETAAYPFKVMGGMFGGAQREMTPRGASALYQSGKVMPAAYGNDADIFSDGGVKASAKGGQEKRRDEQSGDADIFTDVPAQMEKREKPQPREATILERGMALPAGVNRGVMSVLGLPVDTLANVIDLAKAGFGTVATMAGRPEMAPNINKDRSGVVGSSDWIASKINRGADSLGVRSPIDNPAPQDVAARILYSGGLLTGAALNPNPGAKVGAADQAINASTGLVGGLLSGGVGEVAPEWAPVAAMLPPLALQAGAAAARGVVRGGEAGRRAMAQRMQDFKNAGVEAPSVGLASSNKLVQGVENLLSNTPGSMGVFDRSREKMVTGMQNRTNQIRDEVSPSYGQVGAGEAIQRDLTGAFKGRINNTQGQLDQRVQGAIGSDQFTTVDNAIRAATGMSTPIPGAVNTSTPLINPRIAGIARNLQSDVVGTPIPSDSMTNSPTRYRRADGVVTDRPPGIPFSALRSLRTDIGKEAGSTAIIGTPEQGQFKRLYGALSQDMKQAVSAADRRNAGVAEGPLQPGQTPGSIALNRSNRFYSKAMGEVDDLNGIANRATPEGAYSTVARSLDHGPTTYGKVRNAVTPDTRRQVAATVIDDLGKATPGQQNADGSMWSPKTFLTNYNRMDAQGRQELFKRLPGGERHAQNIADIAKAAEMVNSGAKVWANPSGTSANLVARSTLGGGIAASLLLQPLVAGGIAGTLAAGNGLSRLLVSPIFANWLAKAPTVSANRMQSYTQRLLANAKMTDDQQFQQDVSGYLAAVEEAKGDRQ